MVPFLALCSGVFLYSPVPSSSGSAPNSRSAAAAEVAPAFAARWRAVKPRDSLRSGEAPHSRSILEKVLFSNVCALEGGGEEYIMGFATGKQNWNKSGARARKRPDPCPPDGLVVPGLGCCVERRLPLLLRGRVQHLAELLKVEAERTREGDQDLLEGGAVVQDAEVEGVGAAQGLEIIQKSYFPDKKCLAHF